MEALQEFEEKIGYNFKNKGLLKNALTHSSYANERHWNYEANNERLEFLGDAVLELVSSDFIFRQNRNMEEGQMTKMRASLVCEMSLAASARQVQLGNYIILGKGEKSTGGAERDSILSDAFEAVIGAMYLDGGIEPAEKFIRTFVLSDIEKKQLFYDSKTILQEIVQSIYRGESQIEYRLEKESGPDHNKKFEVRCYVNGRTFAPGTGRTKKAAEQQAAYETILLLRQEKA